MCAGCNVGRVKDDTGRPTVEPDTVLYCIKFRRPGALTGHEVHLCRDCLDDLVWVAGGDLGDRDV